MEDGWARRSCFQGIHRLGKVKSRAGMGSGLPVLLSHKDIGRWLNAKGTLGYLVLFCPEEVNVSWVGWLLPQFLGFAMQHLGLHDSSLTACWWVRLGSHLLRSYAQSSHLNTLLWGGRMNERGASRGAMCGRLTRGTVEAWGESEVSPSGQE